MRVTKFFAAMALILGSSSALAGWTDGNMDGYQRQLPGHYNPDYDYADEGDYVYLNSPYDWQGPGQLEWCRKTGTYSGGPKTGTWRTYYVCKVK